MNIQEAEQELGMWLSAALDDPAVCDSMRADIINWFEAIEQREDKVRQLEIQIGNLEFRNRALRQECKTCDMCNYLERDACIEEKEKQASKIKQLTKFINEIMPRYCELSEDAGLGNSSDSISVWAWKL